MALICINTIYSLVYLFRRLRILTPRSQTQISGTNTAICVSSYAGYHVFPANLAGSQAIVICTMDILSAHGLVIHLHYVSLVS